jgi:DNA-binding LytR/AlgR family response regulator
LKDKTLLSRSTFSEAENQLPPDQFTRIHRSYIVAVNKIDKLERHQVTIGKVAIPVGEAYSQNLQVKFNR